MSTTTVLRVAPPAVVVRSVIRALQVQAREGMPGLDLVEPRGRSFLRAGWGRGRACLSLGGHTPCWVVSARTTTGLPATSSPMPCASGGPGRLAAWTDVRICRRVSATRRQVLVVQLQGPNRRASVEELPAVEKSQQKALWAVIREETGRGKDRFKILELSADERCSKAI